MNWNNCYHPTTNLLLLINKKSVTTIRTWTAQTTTRKASRHRRQHPMRRNPLASHAKRISIINRATNWVKKSAKNQLIHFTTRMTLTALLIWVQRIIRQINSKMKTRWPASIKQASIKRTILQMILMQTIRKLIRLNISMHHSSKSKMCTTQTQ